MASVLDIRISLTEIIQNESAGDCHLEQEMAA